MVSVPSSTLIARPGHSGGVAVPLAWRWLGLAPRHDARAEGMAVAVIAAVALVLRLAFDLRAPPFVTNDSLSYLLPGYDLIHTGGFAPLLKRPPLYPLFVGGLFGLFGDELRALTLVQHLLGVLTVLL